MKRPPEARKEQRGFDDLKARHDARATDSLEMASENGAKATGPDAEQNGFTDRRRLVGKLVSYPYGKKRLHKEDAKYDDGRHRGGEPADGQQGKLGGIAMAE